MNAIEFVEALKNIPSEVNAAEYKRQGLDDDFVLDYWESYSFKAKGKPVMPKIDPIEELVENYDGNSVSLGMVTFDIEPQNGHEFYLFGRFEIDLLVINKVSGEIEMREYKNEKHILGVVARDSSCFLSAMVEAAKFLDTRGVDDHLYEDQAAINDAVYKCSNLAGGEKYLGFYKVLLGSEL